MFGFVLEKKNLRAHIWIFFFIYLEKENDLSMAIFIYLKLSQQCLPNKKQLYLELIFFNKVKNWMVLRKEIDVIIIPAEDKLSLRSNPMVFVHMVSCICPTLFILANVFFRQRRRKKKKNHFLITDIYKMFSIFILIRNWLNWLTLGQIDLLCCAVRFRRNLNPSIHPSICLSVHPFIHPFCHLVSTCSIE